MAIQTLSGELYNKEEVEAIKEELNVKINEIVITGGGVSPATFEETVTRLEETDSTINAAILTLQEADVSINDRVTALEAGSGSGGSTTDLTVVNERLTALEAEDDATIARVVVLENKDLTLTDNITALQEADATINDRVTALEAGGGSGGSTTNELLVLTLDADVEKPTDTTTWLLKETINFDTLYQSYLAKTNKPVVINIAMSDDTGNTQYSFRDVITSAEDAQIRITGDAMSAAIAPNTRFTIDLALIKDEATGNCIINTAESKFLMQEDTGGSTPAEDKNLIIKLEVISPEALDDGISISNLRFAEETNFNALFEKAKTGEYNATVNLIIGKADSGTIYYSAKPVQLQVITENTEGRPLIFCDVIFDLGDSVLTNLICIKSDMNGNCIIDSDSGENKFQEFKVASKDAVDALDERVTALEENDSGGGDSTDDLSSYTYIIDSQEKFDAFCVATNATEADDNDYSHVYIKNGNYTQTNAIKIDNTVVPVLTITGESKEGVVITYNVYYTSAVFDCTLLCQDSDEKPEVICTVQNCTFMYEHTNEALFLTQAYNYESDTDTVSYSYTPINFFNCILNTTSTFSCLNLAQCTVNINFKYKDSSNAASCACILCEQAIDTTIVYNQEVSKTQNYILYGLHILKDKNTMCKNVNVIIEQLKDRNTLDTISYFNTCIDCTCTLAINQTNMALVGYLNMSSSTSAFYTRYTGFTYCTNLTNCTALHFSTGFLNCTNLTNCTALFKYMYFYKSVTLDKARTNCGFEMCHNLTNCNVATSNHDVTTNNTKANELLNINKKRLLIDGAVSSNVKTLYAGFFGCENLINCHDNVEDIIHICKYASLAYYSFVSCTYVQGCSTSLKNIYITNNILNEANWSIYPYYQSHYLTQNTLAYATAGTNSFGEVTYKQKLNVLDYRQSTSTSLPIKIYFTYISGCSNVSNMYLAFETNSSTSLGTSLFNIRACYKVKNVTNSDIKVATTTGTKNADSQLTGVHNCVLYSPETSTCSASQTYVADYAVADTPAGGFNKIVS